MSNEIIESAHELILKSLAAFLQDNGISCESYHCQDLGGDQAIMIGKHPDAPAAFTIMDNDLMWAYGDGEAELIDLGDPNLSEWALEKARKSLELRGQFIRLFNPER